MRCFLSLRSAFHCPLGLLSRVNGHDLCPFPTTGLRRTSYVCPLSTCLFRMLGTPIQIVGWFALWIQERDTRYGRVRGVLSPLFLRQLKKWKPNPRDFDKQKPFPVYSGLADRSSKAKGKRRRRKSKTYTQPHAVLAYQSLNMYDRALSVP